VDRDVKAKGCGLLYIQGLKETMEILIRKIGLQEDLPEY
jgi:hypothetical protein